MGHRALGGNLNFINWGGNEGTVSYPKTIAGEDNCLKYIHSIGLKYSLHSIIHSIIYPLIYTILLYSIVCDYMQFYAIIPYYMLLY